MFTMLELYHINSIKSIIFQKDLKSNINGAKIYIS